MPVEARIGCCSPWTLSYGGFLAVMWMLGTEPGSSSRVANAFNC